MKQKYHKVVRFAFYAMTLMAIVLIGIGRPTTAAAQAGNETQTVEGQAKSGVQPAPIEFQEIHPDARKLITEEIRLEIRAENEKRFDDLTSRAEKWVGIISGLLAALGATLAVLGWRGLAGLRDGIRNDVFEFVRTDSRFQRDLEAKLTSVSSSAAASALDKGRREISFARLEFLARKVSESDGFSDDELFAMKSLLRSVKDDPEITESSNFNDAAAKVIGNLCAANLDPHIDELEEEFRSKFLKVVPICDRLVHAYGERMLENEFPSAEVLKRFEMYAETYKQNGLLNRAGFAGGSTL